MTLIIGLALALLPLLLMARERTSTPDVSSLIAFVTRHRQAALAGDDPRDIAILGRSCANQAAVHLSGLLLAARLAGDPVQDSLASIQKFLRSSESLFARRRRLLSLIVFRFASAALMIWGGRYLLDSWLSNESQMPSWDWLAQGLAIVSLLVPFAILWHRAPSPWAWKPASGLSPEGLEWMSCCASLTAAEKPVAPEESSALRELSDREWTSGVTLINEKRAIVDRWADSRHHRDITRLEQCEEWLPAWELAALGVSAALMFAGPMAALLPT